MTELLTAFIFFLITAIFALTYELKKSFEENRRLRDELQKLKYLK